MRSAIRAPIVSGRGWVGTLTLVYAEPGRRHEPAALDVATELAARLGPALDRLWRLEAAEGRRRLSDEFVAAASHEFRTPLAVMRLLLESLQRVTGASELPDRVAERLQRGFERAVRQCERVVALSDRLLDAARLESGRFGVDRHADVDLAELVRETTSRMFDLISHAGCELRLRIPPASVGRWDAVRLEQVVTKLLSNALKYAPAAPIEISLAGDARTATLTIRDHGPGLTPAQAERIFQRFDRSGAAKGTSGWGLGLYLTRQIVEAHGGTIGARNEAKGGLAVVVELPRAPAVAEGNRLSDTGAEASAIDEPGTR